VAAATPVIDLGLPHVGFVDNVILKSAWENPGSVQGAYITAALTAKGFNEENPSGPATVTSGSLSTLFNHANTELIMGQLVIPGCFHVSIEMVAGGRQVVNVIGVANSGGTAAGAGAAVLAAWKVASGPLSRLSNFVAMTNVHAVDIGSSGGAIVDIPDTTVGGQTTTNSLATRGACMLVRWNGSTRNRSSRGRMYVGPIREADIQADGATMDTTLLATWNTAITNFRSSLAGAGYPLQVLSRKTSTAYPVSTHGCESIIATQRRRIRS
jgi:hypothetical protein